MFDYAVNDVKTIRYSLYYGKNKTGDVPLMNRDPIFEHKYRGRLPSAVDKIFDITVKDAMAVIFIMSEL